MDLKPTVTSRLVALAWVRGSINNAIVRALLGGCTTARAGTAICAARDAGHLVLTKGSVPKAWGLSAERAEAVASMTNLLPLRTEADQLAHVAQRVSETQAALRELRTEQRKAALASAATANRQARQEAKLAGAPPPQPALRPRPARPVLHGASPVPAQAAPVQAPPGIAPVLVRGGWLAPSDGPYIRPDGLAHLAAPSRQGDALVAHRPPRSAP